MKKGSPEINRENIEPGQPSCYKPETCLAKKLIEVMGPRGCQSELEEKERDLGEELEFCYKHVVLELEKPRVTPCTGRGGKATEDLVGGQKHSHPRLSS